MLIAPYVCYLIAEGLELSGIVSILVNGIFLNYYATPNIVRQSRKVIKIAVDTVAFVTESMVFLFLGIGVFAIKHPFKEMGWSGFVITTINLNLARYFNVYIVSFFVNKSRSEGSKINGKQKFVMWVAGLRGAMAYALALDIAQEGMAGQMILVITLLYSLFTILGISSFLYPIMKYCEVTGQSEKDSVQISPEQ